jgi:hypothetical protein
MMALPRPTEIPIIVDETHAFDDRRRTEAYPLYEIGDGSIAHDDAVGTRNRLAVGRGGAKHRESAEVNRDEVDRDHDAVPARPQVLGQPVGARLVDFAAVVDWRRLKTRARRTAQAKNQRHSRKTDSCKHDYLPNYALETSKICHVESYLVLGATQL